jgi:hypothetical protein
MGKLDFLRFDSTAWKTVNMGRGDSRLSANS